MNPHDRGVYEGSNSRLTDTDDLARKGWTGNIIASSASSTLQIYPSIAVAPLRLNPMVVAFRGVRMGLVVGHRRQPRHLV